MNPDCHKTLRRHHGHFHGCRQLRETSTSSVDTTSIMTTVIVLFMMMMMNMMVMMTTRTTTIIVIISIIIIIVFCRRLHRHNKYLHVCQLAPTATTTARNTATVAKPPQLSPPSPPQPNTVSTFVPGPKPYEPQPFNPRKCR